MTPPIPFPSNVPIVGQAAVVKAGYPTALIQCQCEAREPLVLIGNAPNTCPACQRSFIIAGFAFSAAPAQSEIRIGLLPPPALGTA